MRPEAAEDRPLLGGKDVAEDNIDPTEEVVTVRVRGLFVAQTASRFFAVINTFRAYSMIYVVLEHTQKILGYNQCWGEAVGLPLWATSLLWPVGAQKSCGANGVAFFFVLSGAVAWLPFTDSDASGRPPRKLPTDDGLNGLIDHWLKRGSRLLPMYYIALYVFYNTELYWGYVVTDTVDPGDAANSANWWKDWALSMTLTNTFTTKFFYPSSYGLLWAISPIYWFSIIAFPYYAYLFKYDREAPHLSAALALSAAVSVSMFIRTATKVPFFGLQVDETQGAVSDSFLGRMDDFVVGMACTTFLRMRSENVNRGFVVLAGIGGYLAVAAYTYFIQRAIEQGFDYSTNQYIDEWWVYSSVLAPLRSIGYAACVVGLHHSLQGKWLTLPRYLWLTNHLIQALGTMSYSIFVWHFSAIYGSFGWGPSTNYTPLPYTPWRMAFTVLFLMMPMVVLSFIYIENGRIASQDYPQADDDLRGLLGITPPPPLASVETARTRDRKDKERAS